ncbi:hypothetical protein BOX15_Mlig000047g3 [Macrostomum lignano]|nr:hypothetical protein BOX15_Mlig000047g3 [Macrostomum lignano]
MTRSIGDCEMKPFGVTAQPHLRCLEVRHGRDAFLLLVTDGVAFVMSVKEMVDIASTCATPQEAAEIIVDQAMQFGSEDNTTAVILPFGSWGKYAKQMSCMPYSMGRNFLANRFTSS